MPICKFLSLEGSWVGGCACRIICKMSKIEQTRREEWRVDSLLGNRYLDFICPRRMPTNVRDPSRALSHRKKTSVFLFAWICKTILKIKSAPLILLLLFLPFIKSTLRCSPLLLPPSQGKKQNSLWVFPTFACYVELFLSTLRGPEICNKECFLSFFRIHRLGAKLHKCS